MDKSFHPTRIDSNVVRYVMEFEVNVIMQDNGTNVDIWLQSKLPNCDRVLSLKSGVNT